MYFDRRINTCYCFKRPKKKEKTFKILLEKYQKRLYWHIRKMVLIHEDAKDVLQNTFLKVYKGINGFNEKSQLHTWMYRIAYNESITFLNAKQKRLRLSSEELNTKILEELKEDVYFKGDEINYKLQQALLRLPTKQKQVFQMRYYDDLKFKEIAIILNATESTLRSSYQIAVDKIKKYLT